MSTGIEHPRARRVAVVVGLVLTGLLALAGPASAHPTDQVIQQVYLTPAGTRLTVELAITPGVLVAPRFAGSVDTDGDGAPSRPEQDAFASVVAAGLSAAWRQACSSPRIRCRWARSGTPTPTAP